MNRINLAQKEREERTQYQERLHILTKRIHQEITNFLKEDIKIGLDNIETQDPYELFNSLSAGRISSLTHRLAKECLFQLNKFRKENDQLIF